MPNAKVKLLVVDDDVSLLMLLSQIFTESGYSVRSAEDGFSALAEIRNEIPNIILSDLNMPGMSGFEFLSVVRRRFSRNPCDRYERSAFRRWHTTRMSPMPSMKKEQT